ncbi:MAG: hypothetical protein HUU37_07320, partial [Bdellovibrionales bacterium]|nr:hypothetical protein [Bdellovibrionales bacterium]
MGFRLLYPLLLTLALGAMGTRPKQPGMEEASTCLDEARLPSERELLRQIKAVVDRSQGIACEKLEVGAWR